jgi:hypothetical protein
MATAENSSSIHHQLPEKNITDIIHYHHHRLARRCGGEILARWL